MVYNDPTPEQVAALKSQHADRTLNRVECVDGEDSYVFVMTSPLEVEHEKYTDEIMACAIKRTDKEKIEAVRKAIMCAALAQIRFPDRAEATRVFSSRPEMIQKFAELLREHAGSEVEIRTKKL